MYFKKVNLNKVISTEVPAIRLSPNVATTFSKFKSMHSHGVNVSRVLPKLLRTQPHIVENRGITMAPLFLRLTS